MEQALFQRAVDAHGEAYLQVRAEAVKQGPAVRAFLQERAKDEEHWRGRLVAAALLLATEDPDLCALVVDLMRGQIASRGPRVPITGTWSAADRGEEIAALGAAAGARVLELLVLAEAPRELIEHEALVIAARELEPPDVAAALRFVAGDHERDGDARAAAVAALGRLGDSHAVELLIGLLSSRQCAPSLRIASARALGRLNDRRAVAALLATLQQRDAGGELRASCAYALASIGERGAASAIAEVLATEQDLEVVKAQISALEDLDDGGALALLSELATSHHVQPVREAASDAHALIAKRREASDKGGGP